jgi:hypothetical protein
VTANFYIRQLIEQVGCDGVGCDRCKYKLFERDFVACTLTRGLEWLTLASRLWELAGTPQPELASLAREILAAPELRKGGFLIKRDQIESMLALTDGLEEKLVEKFGSLSDPDQDRARSERTRFPEAFVEMRTPGEPPLTLAFSQAHLRELREYLQYALKLGRELVYDAG